MLDHKHKVLIVDDSPDNVDILQELLEDRFDLSLAISGEECLEKISAYKPDIILLDVMMPGIDGIDVCKQLRAADTSNTLKIIFISAKAQLSDKLIGYSAGADDYIIKPFEKDFVLAKILVYSRITSAERAGQQTKTAITNLAHGIMDPLKTIKESCQPLLTSQSLHDTQLAVLKEIIATMDSLSLCLEKIELKE